jgi:hypothetical protein
MLQRYLARDLVIIALSAGLWWLLAARSAGTGVGADFSGWIVGAMLFFCAHIVHEWGHYLGAVLTGSRVGIHKRLTSPFFFRFEAEGNTLKQFIAMSLGGFVATGSIIAFYYLGLPDEYLASRIARGGALFGAFLGVTLEVPLLLTGIFQGQVPQKAAV